MIIMLIFSMIMTFGACTTTSSPSDESDPQIEVPDDGSTDVTDPDVTDPDVTDPDVADPDVTDPDVTEPEVTYPDGYSDYTHANLIWQDEFNGTEVDTTKWNFETGPKYNNEEQWYLEENASVEDGALIIEARDADQVYENNGTTYAYTSAKLSTENTFNFMYGKIEARIQLPAGTGMWPAFWMMGVDSSWPNCGEIDIMEAKGRLVGEYSSAIHFNNSSYSHDQRYDTYEFTNDETTEEYHVYGCEWTEHAITFLIDGKVWFSVDSSEWWPNDDSRDNGVARFDQEAYMMLNLAVGGDYDNARVPEDGDLPSQMLVDYVRVYSLDVNSVDVDGFNILDETDLKWNDEFNSTEVNEIRWNVENSESETNSNLVYASQNTAVSNGAVTLSAGASSDASYDYSSAKMTTKDKLNIKYGKIETRIKMSTTSGVIPKFTMMPQSNVYGEYPLSGQINLCYGDSSDSSIVGGGIVYEQFYLAKEDNFSYEFDSGTTADYHIYSCEWTENEIIFSIDGVVVESYSNSKWKTSGDLTSETAPFDEDFYFALELEADDTYAGANAQMTVDYVRVYNA